MGSCCMGSAEGWRVLLAVDAGEVEGYRIELIISIRKHGVCLATPRGHLHSWCCFPGWPLLPFYLCSMGHHQEFDILGMSWYLSLWGVDLYVHFGIGFGRVEWPWRI